MIEELKAYLEQNRICYEQISGSVLLINKETYQLIEPNEEGKLFDEDFNVIINESTFEDNYVLKFGNNWFYFSKSENEKPYLKPLKYLGKIDSINYPFLGVHGKYEILNGSRDYYDWCKKAKFLNIDTLGICELNTLAGILPFQLSCKDNKIKPILGATYTIFNIEEDYRYEVKCFIKDETGWQNILKINYNVNVINSGYIDEEVFLTLLEGLIIVLDPKSILFENIPFEIAYYQIEYTEFLNNETDKDYLLNLQKFLKSKKLKPIYIQDAYYLDEEDSHIKRKLNKISNHISQESIKQHLKSFDEFYSDFFELFNNEQDFNSIIKEAVKNLNTVCKKCTFQISTGSFFLPNYELTPEQTKQFKDKTELFYHLLEKSFKERGLSQEYRDRLNIELNILNKKSELINYFLILWDIVNWCKQNDILVGVGRGSAGGSLVSMLLGIINIDPIKYGLLFERFLNENRVNKSLPDIDCDFEGLRRDEVKKYMEQRFKNFCSVGTYGNIKIKMGITDLSRLENIEVKEVKYLTAILNDMKGDGTKWSEIFHVACKNSRLKAFIKKYPQIFENLLLCLNQPRSMSVHACATIITPNDRKIYEYIPVKKIDGELVSEWEGVYLDKAGFLKEDILGVAQLDKFASIIKLVKKDLGVDVDFYNIPLDDKKVYEYFSNGWNTDVFQFGSRGLKSYCKQVKPFTIEELIAINALYRPGAMASNAHRDFVSIKFGDKEIKYDHPLEQKFTKETYGLYIYQEQAMLAAQILANMSLTEADDMRKIMMSGNAKKQQFDKFIVYQNKFIDGCAKNDIDKELAKKIWDKMEAFGTYGFNKSHSAAYAITGYFSQWFKVNYPHQFWATAFSFAKDDTIMFYLSEIKQLGDINISPCHINKSQESFFVDSTTNTIYFSLTNIKQCGEKAVEYLLKEREKGEFYSFEDFLERIVKKGSKVTKQIIENLIMSGAFDELEEVKKSRERLKLISKYRKSYKIKIDEEKDFLIKNSDNIGYNWWWELQQKRLSGLAFFDYEAICNKFLDSPSKFLTPSQYQDENSVDDKVKIGGYINEINVRTSKKGKYADILLESNYEFIYVKVWAEQYKVIEKLIADKEKCLMIVSGTIKYDSYKEENILMMNDSSEILILE